MNSTVALMRSFFAVLVCPPIASRHWNILRAVWAKPMSARFLKTAPSNRYAVVDKDGCHLSAEPTEKLDQAGQDRSRPPQILAGEVHAPRETDLLIKVDNQLGFTRNFLTPAPC
jgi:hypothetical protein